MVRQLIHGSVLLLVLSGASCSDDGPEVLEQACRVIVEDCGVGTSVGACLDDLGDQLDACLDCIASGGCDYAERCDRDAADPADERRCTLPAAYIP